MTGSPSPFDEIARRARVTSATSYELDNLVVAADPTTGWQAAPLLEAASTLPPLVRQLQHQLYESCYLRRRTPATAPRSSTDLTPALSAANGGAARWDPGWVIQQLDVGGLVWVTRDGQSRAVWGGEFLSAVAGTAPRVGAQVSLYAPHESSAVQPGFYFAFGDVLGDQMEDLATVRFYWNVSADEAPALLGTLARGLRQYAVPFRLKALSVRELYSRPDAMVLYVPDRYGRVAGHVCWMGHQSLGAMTGRSTPLFTRTLAEGLGAAEDPGNGESFGMSRCRLAAEGLWNAFVGGVKEPGSAAEVVRAHVRRYGLDPDRPWLNPRSADFLELPSHV
jgi:hypothetical protein